MRVADIKHKKGDSFEKWFKGITKCTINGGRVGGKQKLEWLIMLCNEFASQYPES